MNYLSITLGGALGALMRYFIAQALEQYPKYYATLVVNIIGCFLLAMFVVWSQRFIVSEQLRLFATVGCFGAFTTFSTFSFEVLELIQLKLFGQAIFYSLGSLMLGLLVIYIVFAIFDFNI